MDARERQRRGNYFLSSNQHSVSERSTHPDASSEVGQDNESPRIFPNHAYNDQMSDSFHSVSDDSAYTTAGPALSALADTPRFMAHHSDDRRRFSQAGHPLRDDEPRTFSHSDAEDALRARLQSFELGNNEGSTATIRQDSTNTQVDETSLYAQGQSSAPIEGLLLVGYTRENGRRMHDSTWCFPDLTIERMGELLAHKGFRDALRNCPVNESNTQAGASLNLAPAAVRSDHVAQSRARGASTQPNSGPPKIGISGDDHGSDTDSDPIHFACLMVKHKPRHYRRIFNPCTIPPGFKEFRRVTEHMKDYHSIKKACPFCHKEWAGRKSESWTFANASAAYTAHRDHCKVLRSQNLRPQPEILDETQTEALEQSFRGPGSAEEKWRVLFERLFPGHSAPSPYYDYYHISDQCDDQTAAPRVQATPNTSFDILSINSANYYGVLAQNEMVNGFQASSSSQAAMQDPFLGIERQQCGDTLAQQGNPCLWNTQEADQLVNSGPSGWSSAGSRSRGDSGYASESIMEHIYEQNTPAFGATFQGQGFFNDADPYGLHEYTSQPQGPLLPGTDHDQDRIYQPGINQSGDQFFQQRFIPYLQNLQGRGFHDQASQ